MRRWRFWQGPTVQHHHAYLLHPRTECLMIQSNDDTHQLNLKQPPLSQLCAPAHRRRPYCLHSNHTRAPPDTADKWNKKRSAAHEHSTESRRTGGRGRPPSAPRQRSALPVARRLLIRLKFAG
ncbi:hypothetical protein DPEC_G00083140 [Dallia pectoralis]|uniref:Uncharacterized protein n=1 Tax=Dallia pectoralis TaxID=75939 RepID=A0ACC2GYX8_DALPE|nr:hypothetical protein DPEC_G00083140 [Dallia pectoralis]